MEMPGGFVAVMIIVVLIVAASFYMLMPVSGFDVTKYFTAAEGLGDKGNIDVLKDLITSENAENAPADHIFTAEDAPHDLSEIACLIGEEIYTDFLEYGDSSRPMNPYEFGSAPAESGNPVFIGGGSFIYKKNTDATKSDTVFDDEEYPDCHICKSGSVGIHDLDELCINMQLGDRIVGGFSNFCGPGDISTNTGPAEFSNDNIGAERNTDVSGWGDDLFCDDNDQDKIRWYVNAEPTWTEKWKASYTNVKYPDSNDAQLLADGWKYIFGVFWIEGEGGDRYDAVFTLMPDEDARPTVNNVDDIATILADKEFIRMDVLGNKYFQARTVADYKVTLPSTAQPISIEQNLKIAIEDAIQDFAALSTQHFSWLKEPYATCDVCSGDGCYTNRNMIRSTTSQWDYEPYFNPGAGDSMGSIKDVEGWMPVNIYVDINDADGNPLDCSGALLAGKTYRVVINEWINYKRYDCGWFGCKDGFKYYDRSVIIQEVTA